RSDPVLRTSAQLCVRSGLAWSELCVGTRTIDRRSRGVRNTIWFAALQRRYAGPVPTTQQSTSNRGVLKDSRNGVNVAGHDTLPAVEIRRGLRRGAIVEIACKRTDRLVAAA